MKTEKRNVSNDKKLIIGIVITLIILSCLLYFYHNYWKHVYIVNNVPTSITGVLIIIVISLTICTVLLLGGILLSVHIPGNQVNEKQMQNLSNDFVKLAIKDFDTFPLAKFISKEDISCIAKLDEKGNIVYSLNITTKLCQTRDYELFLKHFDI